MCGTGGGGGSTEGYGYLNNAIAHSSHRLYADMELVDIVVFCKSTLLEVESKLRIFD